MDISKALGQLGVGLSRVLRYSYGGFLVVAFAALLNPGDAKPVLDAMGWKLAGITALVIGAGVYATHRHLLTSKWV